MPVRYYRSGLITINIDGRERGVAEVISRDPDATRVDDRDRRRGTMPKELGTEPLRREADPGPVSQVTMRRPTFESRSQPKKNRPPKVNSSIASGVLKTSPI